MGAHDVWCPQVSLFRGVAEDIDMAVLAKAAGGVANGIIMPGDDLISVLEWDTESAIATLADVTANCSIARAGYLTNDTAPTSDIWQGMAIWNKKNVNQGDLVLDNWHPACMLVTGGNAAANLTATGLAITDDIFAVIHVTTAASVASFADITHLCTHATASVLNCSIATNNDQLWVFYNDRSGTGYDNLNLKISVLAGTTATTDITVTGCATTDPIFWCGHISTAASIATIADITSECSFTDANDLQLATTDTSSDALLLIWGDQS